MVFRKLRQWQKSGTPQENRATISESRSLPDGSLWVRIILRHDYEGNKFAIDRSITIKPDEDEQFIISGLVDQMTKEYDAALLSSMGNDSSVTKLFYRDNKEDAVS